MDRPTWCIQIFQMSSLATQESMVDTLAGSPLIIDAQSCERGFFLIVESRDGFEAKLVRELVAVADSNAHLLHETSGAAQQLQAI